MGKEVGVSAHVHRHRLGAHVQIQLKCWVILEHILEKGFFVELFFLRM